MPSGTPTSRCAAVPPDVLPEDALRHDSPAEVLALTPYLQIGVYHHVTGVDASSSASLAAYINTLTHTEPHGQQGQTKIAEGLYWFVIPCARKR